MPKEDDTMTKYLLENYYDNLNSDRLAKFSSEELLEVASSCQGLCEVCRAYIYEVLNRLREKNEGKV